MPSATLLTWTGLATSSALSMLCILSALQAGLLVASVGLDCSTEETTRGRPDVAEASHNEQRCKLRELM